MGYVKMLTHKVNKEVNMASTLVAGRVDCDVSARAQFYIDRANTTQAEVIRYVWQQISETGEVPMKSGHEQERQERLLTKLQELRENTPHCERLEKLTSADLKIELANRE